MTLANLSRRQKGSGLPSLFLVTDDRRLPDPVPAMRRLPAGAAVLFRHYAAVDRPALAARLCRLARQRRLVFLVAGSQWRLAAAIGADGVHLPEAVARRLCDPGLRLWWRRRRKVLTVACHGHGGLARAAMLGADGALLSPVFATASHPGGSFLGPLRFSRWARQSQVPVVALGGVNRRTIRRLYGAAGVAAIGGLAK